MNDVIMDFEVIEDTIYKALDQMLEIKKTEFDGKWRDADEETEGLIILCEAMLSFLIPAFRIKKSKEYIIEKYDNEIISGLKQILKLSEKKFVGTPYWNEAIEAFGNEDDVDFLESAASVLQTMIIVKELLKPEKLNPYKKQIDLTIERALKVINECFVDDVVENYENKGWTFLNDDKLEAYLYCCWTAAETYGLLKNKNYNLHQKLSPKSKTHYKDFERNIGKMRGWLEDRHINNPDKYFVDSNLDISSGKAVSFDEIDQSIFYNLWIIIALIVSESEMKNELQEALGNIEKNYTSSERMKDNYNSYVRGFRLQTRNKIKSGSKVTYNERSFIPLTINAIVLFKAFASHNEELNDGLNELLNSLMENRLESFPYVWDKWGLKGYSIFYTKRAIESLSMVHEYYTNLTKNDGTLKLSIEIPNQQLNLLIDALISNDDFISKIAENSKFKAKIENKNDKVPPMNTQLEGLMDAVEGPKK